MQADQRGLVPQLHRITHPAEGSPWIGGAGAGDRPTGQVTIVDQDSPVPQGQHHLPLDEGAADGLQGLLHGGDGLPGADFQGAADAAVIGPTLLSPGSGDRQVLIQRMGTPTDVLQVGRASENGDQELDHLRLGGVIPPPLGDGGAIQTPHQANALGKEPPRHQHGVAGESSCWSILALRWQLAHREPSWLWDHDKSTSRLFSCKVLFLACFGRVGLWLHNCYARPTRLSKTPKAGIAVLTRSSSWHLPLRQRT